MPRHLAVPGTRFLSISVFVFPNKELPLRFTLPRQPASGGNMPSEKFRKQGGGYRPNRLPSLRWSFSLTRLISKTRSCAVIGRLIFRIPFSSATPSALVSRADRFHLPAFVCLPMTDSTAWEKFLQTGETMLSGLSISGSKPASMQYPLEGASDSAGYYGSAAIAAVINC
jgi:hypothetical protein